MNQLNANISVDCVIFGFDTKQLKVLLIKPEKLPGENMSVSKCFLKLPGNLIMDTDDLDVSAYRVLKKCTGVDNISLKQFAIFGNPNRISNRDDLKWLCSTSGIPIKRVVTVAYYTLVKIAKSNPAKSLMPQTYWFPVKGLPHLAFDHNFIVESALAELRKKLQTEPFGFDVLPKKFTIRQIQSLYEDILGKKLDSRNFRRKICKLKYLSPLPEKEKKVNHKPAQFYKLDKTMLPKPQKIMYW